ncbi:WbqC family protein [Pseudazoarcus pumilus]|nr:WbqC family protein [Pseudazoarcus pumilus]
MTSHSPNMRIAILQPTFLPWLGWFDIADQADLLILLDDVSFSKQSWQQRNRLRTRRGLEYVTVPVRSAGRLGQPILDVEIAEPNFASKLERTISGNYARAPYFRELFPSFCEALHHVAAQERLAPLNMELIEWFCRVLGINTPRRASSDLGTNGKRGEYVAALCEYTGADEYLSPSGAEDYLLEDRQAFDRRGISVSLHQYSHPIYHQMFSPFMPYASTLDLIFNEGERALEIIRSGRRSLRALGASAASKEGIS